jgi:hypothetical protein
MVKKNAAIGLANIEDPAYVRMRDLPRKAYFGVETLQRFFVPGEPYWQEFEGYGLAELQVIGPVNFAHASLADERDDAVALRQQCPGDESFPRRRCSPATGVYNRFFPRCLKGR